MDTIRSLLEAERIGGWGVMFAEADFYLTSWWLIHRDSKQGGAKC